MVVDRGGGTPWCITRLITRLCANSSEASALGKDDFVFGFQMELDRSADPPPAIWVATTKSTVNKWVST